MGPTARPRMAEKNPLLFLKQERRDFIQNQHLERALYIYIFIFYLNYYNYYILHTIPILYRNEHIHIYTYIHIYRCISVSIHILIIVVLKTNMKEGASSLYHPEILENPAARPGPGHGLDTAATRPGASPDRHFFLL